MQTLPSTSVESGFEIDVGARCPDAPSHSQTLTHPAPGIDRELDFFLQKGAQTNLEVRGTSGSPSNILRQRIKSDYILHEPDKVSSRRQDMSV